MTAANDMHDLIMEVIHEALKDTSVSYADVFGALEVTKAFFTCEYAMRVSLTWRNELLANAQPPKGETNG